MLIESNLKYEKQLTSLWHKVFGDDEGYIKLFFDKLYKASKTFAEFDGEKIVSAFYLLDCKINFNSHQYSGFYLYAAATDPEYRNRGIMGMLIEQAKKYCRENGISFISLVPGSEPLYSYYSKFGFQTAMHKNIVSYNNHENIPCSIERTDVKTYLKMRSAHESSSFIWGEKELDYVFACFDYFNIYAYKGNGFLMVADENSKTVKELICSEEKLDDALKSISSFYGGKPFVAETRLNVGKRIPFGMICPIEPKLERKWSMDDIYMNFALD